MGIDKVFRETLISQFGVQNLPRNAYYGDGSEIEEDFFDEIKQAYKEEKRYFFWEKGDVLLVDNLLFAHGRNPYSGHRKILVSMV